MSTLSKETCVPCKGGMMPLTQEKVKNLLSDLVDWKQEDTKKIWREFKFKDFVQAVDFINRIANIAEFEGHHPDILLYNYNHVRVELMTHAIKGLSRNDFIVAAKITDIV